MNTEIKHKIMDFFYFAGIVLFAFFVLVLIGYPVYSFAHFFYIYGAIHG